MKIINQFTDEAILSEIGHRITNRRIDFKLTQAELAKKSGVSKSTVERIERGASVQLSNFIRVFRVLDLLDNLDRMIPEVSFKPIDLLKQTRKNRVRASRKKAGKKEEGKGWQWKEDK